MSRKVRIAPSLVSAPMHNLGEVIRELVDAGADFVHFDIEDGSFVPVMNLGTKVIGDLRPITKIPFDVHLMMNNPEWLIPQVIEQGANRISVHYEACPYPRRVLRQIVESGAVAGLAFNPKTAIPDLDYLAPYLTFVIVLTTEPDGFGDPFLEEVLQKVTKGKQDDYLRELEWVVDGGVSLDNVKKVVEAGADTIVVGRYIFKNGDIKGNINKLRSKLN